MKSKFKKGDIVAIICEGDFTKLGVITDVHKVEERFAQKQDGLFGEPTGDMHIVYKYSVSYNSETPVLMSKVRLVPISNLDEFYIEPKF